MHIQINPHLAISFIGSALISKYVSGAWTTVQGGNAANARALGINATGQGAALFRNTVCATSACEELVLYRF